MLKYTIVKGLKTEDKKKKKKKKKVESNQRIDALFTREHQFD